LVEGKPLVELFRSTQALIGGRGMTKEQYRKFVMLASDELEEKQNVLMIDFEIGTGAFADYFCDQTTGTLQFLDDRKRVGLEATITPIGSFSAKTNTWLWGWANQSILPELRAKAEKLKGLKEITGKMMFTTRKLRATEVRAWRMASLAVMHLKAMGCYRTPVKHLYFFWALDDIRRKPSGKAKR
jgi:hypothetical protein